MKTPPNTPTNNELLIIMSAVYAGAVIDCNNNEVKKLDEIPKDSRVLNAVAELEALIDSRVIEARLDEVMWYSNHVHIAKDMTWDKYEVRRKNALKKLKAKSSK